MARQIRGERQKGSVKKQDMLTKKTSEPLQDKKIKKATGNAY